jgi:hypothetical protein
LSHYKNKQTNKQTKNKQKQCCFILSWLSKICVIFCDRTDARNAFSFSRRDFKSEEIEIEIEIVLRLNRSVLSGEVTLDDKSDNVIGEIQNHKTPTKYQQPTESKTSGIRVPKSFQTIYTQFVLKYPNSI